MGPLRQYRLRSTRPGGPRSHNFNVIPEGAQDQQPAQLPRKTTELALFGIPVGFALIYTEFELPCDFSCMSPTRK